MINDMENDMENAASGLVSLHLHEGWKFRDSSGGKWRSATGRGRWMDNVFIERLWRSLKYEKLRLWSYQTISELRTLTADWIEFYNHRRKHQAHGYNTPWSVYQEAMSQAA
jgi:transposase InsO family protein